MSPLLFLIKLAWDCRYKIPLLITLGFMALDIRLQVELNIQTRRIRRPRAPSNVSAASAGLAAMPSSETTEPVTDETTWSTIDEELVLDAFAQEEADATIEDPNQPSTSSSRNQQPTDQNRNPEDDIPPII